MERIPIVGFFSTLAPIIPSEDPSIKAQQTLAIEPIEEGLGSIIDPYDRPSAVLTMIGPTQSGKTYLTNCLTNQSHSDHGEAEEGQMESTTGDVTYSSYSETGEDIIHCLDVEGDGGSVQTLPVELQSRAEELVTGVYGSFSTEKLHEYTAMRTRSVKQHFPRLAYAVSDVIVFVDTASLARGNYSEFVREFVPFATEGLVNVPPPVLIVVQNQATPREKEFDQATLTEMFFDKHDVNRTLSNYFSSVYILRVYDSYAPRYEDSMEQFTRIVRTCLQDSRRAREEKGFSLTTAQWVPLLRQVVDRFHSEEVLRIGSILTTCILESLGPICGQTAQFYEMFDCDCFPSQWELARACSVEFMVTGFVKKIRKLDDTYYAAHKGELRDELHRLIDAFLEVTERDRRCTSTMTSKNTRFWCSHTKSTHEDRHYQPDIQEYSGHKIVRLVKKVFKARDNVWRGTFEQDRSIYQDTSASLHDLAEKTLTRMEGHWRPVDIFMMRRCIIDRALTVETSERHRISALELNPANSAHMCRVCFRNGHISRTNRCHVICDSCAKCLIEPFEKECPLCDEWSGHPRCTFPHRG